MQTVAASASEATSAPAFAPNEPFWTLTLIPDELWTLRCNSNNCTGSTGPKRGRHLEVQAASLASTSAVHLGRRPAERPGSLMGHLQQLKVPSMATHPGGRTWGQ